MPVLIEGDRDLAAMHRETLGDDLVVLDTLDRLGDHLRRNPREYAVVLGDSVVDDDAAALAQELRISHPQTAVILLRKEVESDLLQLALRAGVREVVESADATTLRDAVRRAHTVWQAIAGRMTLEEPARAQVVTVFSTKGGVGKSTVALNLAVALSDAGRNVCLLDLDVQCGDIAIMLQLSPTRSLSDLATFGAELDAEAVRSLAIPYSETLSVIASPLSFEGVDDVTPDRLVALFDLLADLYDVVVVDTTGTFDEHTIVALDRSDDLILVGTLDIPSLKNLKLAVSTLDLLEIARDHWHLVLNRADAKAGVSDKDYAQTLDLPVSAMLPTDRAVLAATNRGEPIVRAQPRSAVARGITGLVRTLDTSAGRTPPPTRVRRPLIRKGK